ncbi:thiamine pyrophosphate-dependent enzyme [[Clostridium] colinum]|uniref:thiamine pyrophosphate-dependent enzyme n=1 Tax=[Clostridium] colinum TaxID=36835 RepID=UPI00202424DA|nr:thiamine pyrophosphate-dependent enzyme [[Clostridium] colinum]
MLKQKVIFESGNELASIACKQINYHIMGYYPITPSTQIAENLDYMIANGESQTKLIAAEGEHSALGICYGASVGGGRVFSATSANGLLYSLEQLPVQSGTRFPMVLNVACRTVSGPLSIKGDHSDIMYTLNTGWIILFAKDNQEVYDFNIIGLKLAEKVNLPVIVAFDGFFTSHQKKKAHIFDDDKDVQNFIGECKRDYTALNMNNPITIGSYMNEPDLINNKFQLSLAMEEAKDYLPKLFEEYKEISGREYKTSEGYLTKDADVIIFALGSTFETVKDAVDKMRKEGKKAGAFTLKVLRPWITNDIYEICKDTKLLICLDRQDSYGANGGNMSIEIKASLQEKELNTKVITRIYGISGKDFYVEDGLKLFEEAFSCIEGTETKRFDYLGKYEGNLDNQQTNFFKPIKLEDIKLNITNAEYNEETKTFNVTGGNIKDITAMPKRLAPGHGACPGCGIPVNLNLLLSGIEGNVVLLFQTGCGMVVTTCYPKTSFKVNYVHNLFQNGAATLSGLLEMYNEKKKRGEMLDEDITFIMVSGDGGLDIGLGSALSTAIRNHNMIIFEYDNGGYMNTGYQYSYSTPKGARSSTSHIGECEYGKQIFHKDNPQIFAATNIPYVATVAESHITDFVRKARKAQEYSKKFGLAYIKCLSACPLNWGDEPQYEREVIESAVKSCYHPLYEIEQGITKINYNPEDKNEKIPIKEFLFKMGRTKHLKNEKYNYIIDSIQEETDRRWQRLKARAESPYL